MGKNKNLRSNKKIIQFKKKSTSLISLPVIEHFHRSKLPLMKKVIASIINAHNTQHLTFNEATRVASVKLEEHWTARSIYDVSLERIMKKLTVH